jgi:hypothetical protein
MTIARKLAVALYPIRLYLLIAAVLAVTAMAAIYFGHTAVMVVVPCGCTHSC